MMYNDLGFVEHLHDDFELIYIFKGTIILNINNKATVLNEGDFALILPNQIHSYHSMNHTLSWIGVFSKDYVRDFAHEVYGKQGKFCNFRCDETICNFVFKYMIFAEEPLQNELSACLTILCAQYQKDNTFTEIHYNRETYLYDILNYISLHYTEEISLKAIAQELHINMNYLSRYFHKNIPMNFIDFINHYRVSHAQDLLAQGVDLVETAYSSGFQSIRSFNRVFKSFTGKTPTEYRKQLKELND